MHIAVAKPSQRLHFFPIALLAIIALGGVGAVYAPMVTIAASIVLASALIPLMLIRRSNVFTFALLCFGILISYIAFLPRPTGDRVGPAYGGALDLRAQAQLAIFFAVLALGCWLWAVAGGGVSDLLRFPLNILGIYVIVTVISLLYAPSLAWSAYGVIKFLTVYVVIAVLSTVIKTEADLKRLIDFVLGAIFIVLGVYWVDILNGTAVRQLGRYETSWIHPNHVTLLAVTVMIVLTVRFLTSPQPRGQWRLITLACFAAATAMMASSKSALGAAAIAIVVVTLVILVKKPTGSMLARMVVLIMAGFGVLYYFLVNNIGIAEHLAEYEQGSEGANLTGRVPVWHTAIDSTLATPFTTIFGHGYLSTFSIGLEGEYWVARQAHNSFIQTFFDMGIIGLAVVIILYASTWSRAWRSVAKYSLHDPRWVRSLEILAALTAQTIVSLTEDLMGGTMENISMIFLLTMFCVSKCLTIAPNDATEAVSLEEEERSPITPSHAYSDRVLRNNTIPTVYPGGRHANPASS
jgi:O-antigen ligase